MSIVRFTPSFDVDSVFDDLVRRSLGTTATWSPAADVHQEGADAVITLELPGVSAGDVDIEVKDRALIVSGSRENKTEDENTESGVRVLRREIRRGSFSRSFRLPAHITPDAVKASYENGLLTIRIVDAQPAPVSQKIAISNLETPAVDES